MREGANLLDDVDAVWAPFLEDAKMWEYGPDEIVTYGNLAKINLALGKQTKILVELCKHIEHKMKRFQFFCWVLFLI